MNSTTSIFANRLLCFLVLTCLALGLGSSLSAAGPAADGDQPRGKAEGLALVIMDPLAAPLACDCVKGYAQRKYEALGAYLTKELGQPVQVYWGGALKSALKDSSGRADIIIGKDSVVRHDAAAGSLSVQPVASLTGKEGSTTQTGLIVVRTDDRAKKAADLKGYRIFFGTPDAEEKSAAVMELLRGKGIEIPENPETCDACSGAATQLMELEEEVDGAAVISSYARPLLEGCGTIQKGDLRVIAESEPVPFVTAFVNEALPEETRRSIEQALLKVAKDKELLSALETRDGFVPYRSEAAAKKKN